MPENSRLRLSQFGPGWEPAPEQTTGLSPKIAEKHFNTLDVQVLAWTQQSMLSFNKLSQSCYSLNKYFITHICHHQVQKWRCDKQEQCRSLSSKCESRNGQKYLEGATHSNYDGDSSDVNILQYLVFVHGTVQRPKYSRQINPICVTQVMPEDYDYNQELARAAFADMLHDSERNQLYRYSISHWISLPWNWRAKISKVLVWAAPLSFVPERQKENWKRRDGSLSWKCRYFSLSLCWIKQPKLCISLVEWRCHGGK